MIQQEAPKNTNLVEHYKTTCGLPDPEGVLRRNPSALPGLTGEVPQLTPPQMAELGQKFDRVSGIMHRTVNPNPDDPEEMRLAREFDEADKVAAVGEYAFSPRVPTEELKPIAGVRVIPSALHEELVTLMRDFGVEKRASGKPPIGQPDEFTAAEQITRERSIA